MARHITGEYADVFKELCNSETNGKMHEELGDFSFEQGQKGCEGHEGIPLQSVPRSI